MENKETCIRVYADPVQIKNCKELIEVNNSSLTRLSDTLALAGNDVRLKILFLLEEERELCPCDLSDILGMSIPAISQHLRKMKDGRILKTRKVAQMIFYSIEPRELELLRPFFKHIIQVNHKENQL